MDIKIGEYVRTSEGYIGILIDINKKNWNYLTINCKRPVRHDGLMPDSYLYLKNENIKKHSFNIIDLIEIGDYVNGKEIFGIRKQKNGIVLITNYYPAEYIKCEIESIVTKEKFEEVMFKVGE